MECLVEKHSQTNPFHHRKLIYFSLSLFCFRLSKSCMITRSMCQQFRKIQKTTRCFKDLSTLLHESFHLSSRIKNFSCVQCGTNSPSSIIRLMQSSLWRLFQCSYSSQDLLFCHLMRTTCLQSLVSMTSSSGSQALASWTPKTTMRLNMMETESLLCV